ncbi:MAG: TrmH family RNA methyltransferase [Candidatus Magasanikbacteria bacterium]|nr:TrmH family RNA methyltransferase [Candidatus Magasanikbacteria bacterium]
MSLFLILENIRSRFNVGAIFRTADGAGVEKIFLGGITPAPPHPQIDKVALGAEKIIPFVCVKQIVRTIKQLKKEGYEIVALEQSKKSIPYYNFKPTPKVALILGSEVKGLPLKILALADTIVEIPMYGQKESLNVGVAGGIVIFDITHKMH